MTTFSQVVERTRRRLMTSLREPFNVLTNTIDNDDTTLTLTYEAKGIAVGSRLDIDLEEMYVVDLSGTTPGSTITVIRGLNGSIAASHTAGAIVRVNPQWTNFELGQAVNDELADLSSPVNGLFRVRSATVQFDGVKMGYDLAGVQDFLSVWQVTFDVPGPTREWPVIPPSLYRVNQDADTGDFPSGFVLVIEAGGYPGHDIKVSYKATFDPLVNTSDDVLAVSGLHNEAHDILSLGAAIRVLSGQEAQRSLSVVQPPPRRADEVPPGAAMQALRPLVQQREDRVRAEAARLSRRYPEGVY